MKKITELSIADLKAAHEFIENHLKELNEKMAEAPGNLDGIKVKNEIESLENDLYHEILNRVLRLE